MNVKEKEMHDYRVAVRVAEDVSDQIFVCFAPRRPQREKVRGSAPEFIARVLVDDDKIKVIWDNPPPPSVLRELHREAETRMAVRIAWLNRLTELVRLVQRFAEELGWATKRIEKHIEDSYLGNYEAEALLLQKETVRALLEPVGSSAPGVEGVVDLYLLPGYDDIATLYYYDGGWHLHHATPGSSAAADNREVKSKPLSKAVLRKVLEEMTKYAQ